MDKIYVIVKVKVFNGDEEVNIIGTYAAKEKAQMKFNSEVMKEKNENEYWDEDSEIFDDFIDTATEFCCWEYGYYSRNHTYITIEEHKVE